MIKAELLAAVQATADLQALLNGHALDEREPDNHDDSLAGAAWAGCDSTMRYMLAYMFGTVERAGRVLDEMYDCGESVAWCIQGVRDDDHADAQCACEHEDHFAGARGTARSGHHEYLTAPAGPRSTAYVGQVCDQCADGHLSVGAGA